MLVASPRRGQSYLALTRTSMRSAPSSAGCPYRRPFSRGARTRSWSTCACLRSTLLFVFSTSRGGRSARMSSGKRVLSRASSRDRLATTRSLRARRRRCSWKSSGSRPIPAALDPAPRDTRRRMSSFGRCASSTTCAGIRRRSSASTWVTRSHATSTSRCVCAACREYIARCRTHTLTRHRPPHHIYM